MGESIKVNHGRVADLAGELLAGANKIDGLLNTLEGDLNPLQNDWEGSAKNAYHAAKLKWDTAIGNLKLVLKDVNNNVIDSNEAYQRTDNKNADRFQIGV